MDLLIAGVDEVGRGPWFGPVVAAAVILPKTHTIEGLNDSKKLSEKKRKTLCSLIKEQALTYAIAEASAEEIDQINILRATHLAMQRAIKKLNIIPHEVLIDGNSVPKLSIPARAIIQGDGKIEAISAASIIAKVYRDNLMIDLAKSYPEYGLEKHKGYGTPLHKEALKRLGITPMHRKSFKPIRQLIETA